MRATGFNNPTAHFERADIAILINDTISGFLATPTNE